MLLSLPLIISKLYWELYPTCPGVPTIHDKGLVLQPDFNGSFSYGALVNNDGVAPVTVPVNLEQSPVSSRSTDDLKKDWNPFYSIQLHHATEWPWTTKRCTVFFSPHILHKTSIHPRERYLSLVSKPKHDFGKLSFFWDVSCCNPNVNTRNLNLLDVLVDSQT